MTEFQKKTQYTGDRAGKSCKWGNLEKLPEHVKGMLGKPKLKYI